MEFRFRKGHDIKMGPPPVNLPDPRTAFSVGMMAQDFPGVIFDLRVDEGQEVRRGQVLCVDRLRPEIVFVAPAAGRVSQLLYGAQRWLASVQIRTRGEDDTRFNVKRAQMDGAALRALLLESGAWVAFRSRPFGWIPAPSDRPSAIFVTATDTNPLAADPVAVLAPQMADFQRGAEALLNLTDGPVFLCQPTGTALTEPRGRLRLAHFSGPHPAGLAGTHIHHLWPVSAHRSVWQIGYQDVAAIGHLLETGQLKTLRTLSVAGPGVAEPALVIAPLGVELADLVPHDVGKSSDAEARLISGSVLSGRASRFLGRYDVQMTVLETRRQTARPLLDRVLASLPRVWTGATLPIEAFERALPLDILPVPLLRALAVGDVETAERLGCLELLEDDLALLGWLCPSGCDYGALLRNALDALAQERAA